MVGELPELSVRVTQMFLSHMNVISHIGIFPRMDSLYMSSSLLSLRSTGTKEMLLANV